MDSTWPGAALVGLVLGATLAASSSTARADGEAGSGPLRVAIECQDYGRTKACPAFLLGFVEASPLMLSSPRGGAQVVLYVNTVEIANADRLHLRFVGDVRGAPASIEVDVEVDSRGTDDAQRAQLEPAFLRGIALYVAVRHPDAVKITLEAPAGAAGPAPSTTPWGFSLDLIGFGRQSGPYKSGNGYGELVASRIARRSRYRAQLAANGGIDRQPAVSGVSFNTTRWGLDAGTTYARHLSDHYALELASSTWRGDPKGQFRYGLAGSVAVEWDHYPSDDPRGNQLAVAYGVGYRVEGYNFRNVLGERFAHYAEHRLGAAGSIRKDKISYNVQLQISGELLHPTRRYTLSGSPGVEIQLGDHVDVGLSLSVTKRELPAFLIPDDDAEAIGRAEYAQSLSLSGSINLRLHWDATNGVRNNRFSRL